MQGGAGRHVQLAGELVEWWEDLWQLGMSSRVVLLAVPTGWGRTAVLDALAKTVLADEAPVTLVARIGGRELPEGIGEQATALRGCLAAAAARHPVAELLGLDRLSGITQMGLGVGGLFVSGLAAAAGFLVAGVAVGAAGKAWDDSPAGQDGAVARAARAVASMSTQVPVVVIVDDADRLDEDLALVMIENLVARRDGHVLVTAAADPGSRLAKALLSRARQGITEGLVATADADPDMSYESRVGLARELCPALPDAAVHRIAHRTATFADVFAVAAAPRLAEITADMTSGPMLAAVDAVINARLHRPEPSAEAVIVAWAGGLLHARQAARALEVMGTGPQPDPDVDLLRWAGLERLADPGSTRLSVQVDALAGKHALAAALLDEARRIAADPDCGPVDRVAAGRAAHRVRRDLADRGGLPLVQRELAASLEALGEPGAALEIAVQALEEWPDSGLATDRDWLAGAVLRLARTSVLPTPAPLVSALIAEALAGGAALGLEARIWAAIDLLDTDGQRDAALDLVDQVTAALDEHADLGPAGDRWRLLIAHHSARAGHPGMAARLLAQLLASDDPSRHRLARVILDAGDGPQADIRLQIILLAEQLAALPDGAEDDSLRIHHVLAANHAALGEYRQALAHGEQELSLRSRIHSPDHPDTLDVRHDNAVWTGQSGDPARALRLFQELLPDRLRVLGPSHRSTLATRNNIALWTGQSGDPAGALHLARDLLPEMIRVLGASHPDTMVTRHNSADWTGECGDAPGALRLFEQLLPDVIRVLGPGHPETLNNRNLIALWTGKSGDPARALRLYQDLLPDLLRVLGPDHPDTLFARNSIAEWTGKSGDAAKARRLYQDLLPDRLRVLGPDHPYTLATRYGIAAWTSRCGDAAGALRVFEGLLPDQVRVLGPDHPKTLDTLGNIAVWTGESGNPAKALRLAQKLLPDLIRVLGPDHPDTVATLRNIAYWSGHRGGGSQPAAVSGRPARFPPPSSSSPRKRRKRRKLKEFLADVVGELRDERFPTPRLSSADAVLACPLTFNSVNKFAHGR